MFLAALTVATAGKWIVHLVAGAFLTAMLLLSATGVVGDAVELSTSHVEHRRYEPKKFAMRFM